MLPDSILEGVFFWGTCPGPPRFGMLCMHVYEAHSLHVFLDCLHELCPTPIQNPGSAPEITIPLDSYFECCYASVPTLEVSIGNRNVAIETCSFASVGI